MKASIPIDGPTKRRQAGGERSADESAEVKGAEAEPTLIVTGASAVAVPVEDWSSKDLRDLTTAAGIESLTNAVEPEAG